MELFTRFSTALLFVSLFSSAGEASISSELKQQIRDAASRSALDPLLVESIIRVESNFQKDATSHKGAMGLMQVMPKTADECGITEPYHAVDNLMGACECLRRLINRYRGNLKLALAAYNAGVANVEKYKSIPPFRETKSYVKKILALYQKKKGLLRP
jgi:soluble lytic murein transglycosylase-like protein